MNTRPNAAVFRTAAVAGVVLAMVLSSNGAQADTLSQALVQAYLINPQLRAQRADTRATDENLPSALSGYRPSLNASANDGVLGELYIPPVSVGNPVRYFRIPPESRFNSPRIYSMAFAR